MHAFSRPFKKIFLTITLLAVLLASCSLPELPANLPLPQNVAPQAEPQSMSTPTAALPQQSYEPAIVETVPLAGSTIGVDEEITFYFNQPMARASVESAFVADPVGGGEFLWVDDATLKFKPSQTLQAGASLKMGVNTGAQTATGVAFTSDEIFSFNVADFLHPSQYLPADGSIDISVDAAVVANFDQPVVPLGADPETLPVGFTLDPQVDGRGEWLNTSTYIFTPEPALAGGTSYNVSINPNLTSIAGTSLQQADGMPLAWTFTTAKPRLLEISPSTETPLPLDLAMTLTFNQPMDQASLEANFMLTSEAGDVPGSFAWSDDLRSVTFTVSERLARNTSYWLRLSGDTTALGGTPLGEFWDVEMVSALNFAVTNTTPEEGGTKTQLSSASIGFSTELDPANPASLVSIEPAVTDFGISIYDNRINLNGYFDPNTNYTVTVSGELKDAWGDTLGEDYVYKFRTATATPRLALPYLGSNIYFTSAENASFYVQATNLEYAQVIFGEVPLTDFFRLFGPNGYTERESYQPTLPDSWRQPLNTEDNKSQTIEIELTEPETSLTPGLYYLFAESSQSERRTAPVYVVASHANLVFKYSATDALVWATDVRDGMPFVDETVFIYDETGSVIASGQTDPNGMWYGELPTQDDIYQTYYAMIGQPGAENFGFGTSQWDSSLSPWSFGLPVDRRPPHTEIYFYTDRPVYRPGQTVYYRAILREAYDGRYQATTLTSLPMTLSDSWGENLQSFNPTISPYGTVQGSFTLPADARPGTYNFSSEEVNHLSGYFKVAEYRKPEIDLSLDLGAADIKSGDPINVAISARYFFDAPASDLPIQWALYDSSDYFALPGYQTGLVDLDWMTPGYFSYDYFGNQIANGEGKTNADGTLNFNVGGFEINPGTRELTLEIVAQDDNGQQIAMRQTIQMHPDNAYIGIRAEQWIGREETEMGFDILSVDWDGAPFADLSLRADFKKVTWQRQDAVYDFNAPTFTPVYTPVANTDFVTGPDGGARLSFTPPTPGTYILEVSGGNAVTQVLLWVSGAERAIYPNLPKQHIRLTADQDAYVPGDTAQIFIPNPIEETTYALITVERGTIHRAEILAVEAGGTTYSVPLSSDDAPGVFISAVLLGGQEYRVGYASLDVTPVDQILTVSLTSQPTRSEPGGEVTFGIQVSDSNGAPVQGEFSLAVVDKAVLALDDPNAPPIDQAFYGNAKIGVTTTLSYAADSIYGVFDEAGGLGGGGGEPNLVVRDDFPDTAYWNGQIVTDTNGQAQVIITLPDNTTTWNIDVRGLSSDTRVGSAEMEVVSTKDLLIRPVTPRFMVVGDHLAISAIVHNNTAQTLTGDVSLQAIGFLLDDPNAITQTVSIPANGRTTVIWWGTAQDAETVELVFNSTFGDGAYQDMTRPIWGSLPVLRYTSPQSFVTAGTLESAGVLTEQISLPRSFIPNGGKLEVELAPSLAAAILNGLEAIPAPSENASTEAILSYLLPNVEMYQALQAAGISDPDLQVRLENSLQDGVQRLLDRQSPRYGWGWYDLSQNQTGGIGYAASPARGGSDEDDYGEDDYLSAYVLYGLWRANQAGVYVDETVFANARAYLQTASLDYMNLVNPQDWQKDRLTFIQFVMQMSGGADAPVIDQLDLWKDGLSPWAKALLALTLDDRIPGDARAQSLIANLEADAQRSASGAHWESDVNQWRNPATPNYTTATVLYALAQFDSTSPLIQDATRYLAAHRTVHGIWSSTYESAWALLALTEVARSGSELSADFGYSVGANGSVLLNGQANPLVTEAVAVALDGLQLSLPNTIELSRTEGDGRLYYRAALFVERAAESAPALNKGIEVSRVYTDAYCESDCQAVNGVQMTTGAQIKGQVTITLPEDSYYVVVEDFIPAGAEILDQNLKTSQQGVDATDVELYDPDNPYRNGWGWWYFRAPQIGDEKIIWTADYLPAGTYVLSYTLIPTQAGEYRVLPAHAWQSFFPEVQGTSAGEIFVVR
jgi:uncharacterized protein YfaS (alpha-2-macroglobulin family)